MPTLDTSTINQYMRIALGEAQVASSQGNLPIGAVIIDLESSKIISQGHNSQFTTFDPTAHAEIVAIRRACSINKSPYLPNTALIATTEPCTMCISAILKAKIPRLYFGISNRALIENGFKLIPFDNEKIVEVSKQKIEIEGGVLADECLAQRLLLRKK